MGDQHQDCVGHYDWTVDEEGQSNSSADFIRLCGEVERLIRDDAHFLIAGRAGQTARLILAQLVHLHGLVPTAHVERELKALRLTVASLEGLLADVKRDCVEAVKERDRMRPVVERAISLYSTAHASTAPRTALFQSFLDAVEEYQGINSDSR